MRLKGFDVSIFSLDGTVLLGELQDCTVTSTIGDEDGSSINEISEDPEPVSRMRTITGNMLVEDAPALMLIIESADPVVTIAYSPGGVNYAASALLTQTAHQAKRKALQTESFTLKIKGTPTLTEVA